MMAGSVLFQGICFKPWSFKVEQAPISWREDSNSDPSLDNGLFGHCDRIYDRNSLKDWEGYFGSDLEDTVYHGNSDVAKFIAAECVA